MMYEAENGGVATIEQANITPYAGENGGASDNEPMFEGTGNGENEMMTSEGEDAVGNNGPLYIAEDLKGILAEAPDFHFLENEQSLELQKPEAALIDENEPFSGVEMAGKWIGEALDVRNYWAAVNRIGEDVASYKQAFDENKMGEFDAVDFSKEVLKSGARTLAADSVRMAGNMFMAYGANLQEAPAPARFLAGGAPALFQPQEVGGLMRDFGKAIKDYADVVEDWKIWAPDEEAYSETPSFVRLANIVGSGASQVLAMGAVSKALSARAAYGIFAGQSAGEMFDETLEATGDVKTANVAAAFNGGVTYAIDKMFNPLPRTIAKEAKNTSKLIAGEIIGAPLREAGSEMLQQMLAENLVRQVGFDDTQDLFEGLIESALGAFAGSSVLSGVNGATYLARENYEKARQKILGKTGDAAVVDLASAGMLQMLEKHPEAFQRVLEKNFRANIKILQDEAERLKDEKARALKIEAANGFPRVYDELLARANEAFNDEGKAKVAAAVLSAGALSLYRRQPDMTPELMIENFLPSFKQVNYADFRADLNHTGAVSYMFGGQHAKKADLAKLSDVIVLDDNQVDAQKIWQHTGWHFGADNLARFEISDRDAKLKLWAPEKFQDEAENLVQAKINQLEESKSRIAQLLMKSSNGAYGDYYKQFWEYLEQHPTGVTWFEDRLINDPLFEKVGNFELIDEAAVGARMQQTVELDSLWKDYQNHARDFSEEEYQMVLTMWENQRYRKFIQTYGAETPVAKNNFDTFLADHTEEAFLRPDFMGKLTEILNSSREKIAERQKTLQHFGMPNLNFFYRDLELDKNYRLYLLYGGEYDGNMIDRNFRTTAYRKAFAPKTSSEYFLAQEKFSFLEEEDRHRLAEYLDREEFLFRLDKHLAHVKDMQKKNGKGKYLSLFGYDADSADGQQALQQRLLLNGTVMKLGDLLEHKELFENYPIIADTKVKFVKLKDDAAYHFYDDIEEGPVLEIDAEGLNYAGLKEILLKGASFAVQDIEGFDYSLAPEDRRNFMDRQVFLAKQFLAPDIRAQLEEFLVHFPVADNAEDFIIREKMPVSLSVLEESADVNADAKGKIKRQMIESVDFDKLAAAVGQYFDFPQNESEEYLRKRAFFGVQQMRSHYNRSVINFARINGGYGAALLPWGGLNAEGALDEQMMLKRQNYDDEQLAGEPFWQDKMVNGRKRPQPELMNTEEDFYAHINRGQRNYKADIEALAKGAYEYGTRTINLFEKGDESAIVHESLHYFWDMLHRPEMNSDINATDFKDAVSDLRWEFMRRYRIEKHDDKYYAVVRDTGEVMPELPRGFMNAQDVAEAGAQELFVDKFLRLMDGRLVPSELIGDAMEFYRRFLSELVGKLEIKKARAGTAGRRILEFIKKRIHGG